MNRPKFMHALLSICAQLQALNTGTSNKMTNLFDTNKL